MAAGMAALGCTDDPDPSSADDPFDPELGSFSTSQPVKESSFAVFGAVGLRNVSGKPVTLVDVAPVFAENATLIDVGIAPYSAAPISMVDTHVEEAVEVEGFVLPSSSEQTHEVFSIVFEVRLDPGADTGIIVGADVRYLDGDALRTRRFLMVEMVCAWNDDAPGPCPTTHQGREVFNADPAVLLKEFDAE